MLTPIRSVAVGFMVACDVIQSLSPPSLFQYLDIFSGNTSAVVSGLTADVAFAMYAVTTFNVSVDAMVDSQTALNASMAATDGRITAAVANLTIQLNEALASNSSMNQSLELARDQIRNLTDALATTSSMNELARDQIRNLTAALATTHDQMANITTVLLQLQVRLVAAEQGSLGPTTSSATDASPPLLAIIAVAVAGFAVLVVLILAVAYRTRRAPAVAPNIMTTTMAAPPALAGSSWNASLYSTTADSGAHPSVENGNRLPPLQGQHLNQHLAPRLRSDTARLPGIHMPMVSRGAENARDENMYADLYTDARV